MKLKIVDQPSLETLAKATYTMMPCYAYLTKADEKVVIIKAPTGTDKKLFKLNTKAAFLECVSVLWHSVASKKRIHVQILGEERFKFQELRAAYFCYLKDITNRADSDGSSVQELHKRYKATYLLDILSRENQWFADLVMGAADDKNILEAVNRLLSIADGTITTRKILSEYFDAIKRSFEHEQIPPN